MGKGSLHQLAKPAKKNEMQRSLPQSEDIPTGIATRSGTPPILRSCGHFG